jgi:hypothetical protein
MLTQAHGTQGFNLWAVRGARTPMNVGFAPSLEYYRLGGLCLLRTLDITNTPLKIDRIVYRIVSPYRFENDTKTIRFDEMDRIVLPRLMHRIVSYRFSYRFSYRNDTRHVRGTAVECKT